MYMVIGSYSEHKEISMFGQCLDKLKYLQNVAIIAYSMFLCYEAIAEYS